MSYETLAPTAKSADFLAQLNAQGARGFRFISGMTFQNGAERVATYVKDAATTYTYELLAPAADSAALQSQLNAQGARGFDWAGGYSTDDGSVTVYRKDNNSASTFSYNVLPAEAASAAFLAQANAQGANGFYALSTSYGVGGSTTTLYRKNLQSASTYNYEVLDAVNDDAGALAQMNAEGARGLRFRSDFFFGTEPRKALYEQDLSQLATFTFYTLDPQPTGASFLEQANAEGAKGNVLVGDYGVPSGVIRTFYVTPTACTGFLCDARNPFGF